MPHWSETASDAGDREVESGGHSWRLARQRRLAIVNAVIGHYGCRVSDWMGGQLMVSSLRGRTELVEQLPQVWQVVENIAQRPVDPLDTALLAALRAAATDSP